MDLTEAPITSIVIPPGYQPRAAACSAEQDAELATSIGAWGVLQPVLLRWRGNSLVLIKGQRRIAAAQARGDASIPARIFAEDDPATDAAIRASAMLRAPVNPVDRWRAIQQLLESGLDLARAAATLGVDLRGARRLQALGNIIPEILEAIAAAVRMPREDDVVTIASAPVETQRAAWKADNGKILRQLPAGYPDWVSLKIACLTTRIAYATARFDDEAAARHGVVWHEDLFAPADEDSRHTTDVQQFRAAQQEWVEDQVAGLKAQGYQAEILPPGRHGMVEVPKGMERAGGKPDKAPKSVIRGYWIDTLGTVRIELYKRPKPAAAPAGKGAAASANEDDADAPAPAPAKPPRGISKKGLALIAEAKEAAVREALQNLNSALFKPHFNARVALHALLLALGGSNVTVIAAKYQPIDMAEAVACGMELDDPIPDVENLLRAASEALEAMLRAPRPDLTGSGEDVFRACARVLSAQPPRCDTPEILGELPRAMLQDLARRYSMKASGTATALARTLAGNLPDWTPPEAMFSAEIASSEAKPDGAEAEEMEDAA